MFYWTVHTCEHGLDSLVITGYCFVAPTVESKLSEKPECSVKEEGKMQIKLTSKENWTAKEFHGNGKHCLLTSCCGIFWGFR